MRGAHFERWLALWRQTVDELFAGPRAELAKSHAHRVAHAFHRRLQGLPDDQSSTTDADPADGRPRLRRAGAVAQAVHDQAQDRARLLTQPSPSGMLKIAIVAR